MLGLEAKALLPSIVNEDIDSAEVFYSSLDNFFSIFDRVIIGNCSSASSANFFNNLISCSTTVPRAITTAS
ncbi:hypothetical protein DSO57_1025123 [Entomophthora muscae]|uniref:Uncharacterized protein n=1 Tax=Entomophthora muscae TaxID=34485 RepID=A0ACC2RH75_9FUNG|nr:hypothetical protein DSO57_1025123 [Entomophthora muscae]